MTWSSRSDAERSDRPRCSRFARISKIASRRRLNVDRPDRTSSPGAGMFWSEPIDSLTPAGEHENRMAGNTVEMFDRGRPQTIGTEIHALLIRLEPVLPCDHVQDAGRPDRLVPEN